MNRILLRNGYVITPFRRFRGSVLIEDGKIAAVLRDEKFQTEAQTVDVKGNYVLPGFIDIHVHGGGGCDTMDGNPSSIRKILDTHAEGGTTSLVLSTVSAPLEDMIKAIRAVREAREKFDDGSRILGIHLEGPYISSEEYARGAHDPRYIRNPSPEEIKEILKYSDEIVRVTIAPEIEGAIDLGLKLKSRGIIPCIGHTDATLEDVIRAIEAGYSHVTHIYSSTSMTKRRGYKIPGATEAALLFDELTVEVIADGKHLPSSLIRLILKSKGLSGVCAVTDAIRAAGLPPGRYKLGSYLGGVEVIVEDGVAWLPDRSVFAGSIAMMNTVLKNLVEAGLSLQDAVRMVTFNPARIIGVDGEKGSLTEGKDADIVVMDGEFNVLLTVAKGKIVYDSGRLPIR